MMYTLIVIRRLTCAHTLPTMLSTGFRFVALEGNGSVKLWRYLGENSVNDI